MSDLVRVGRVGKPHGLAGAFFVEEASEDPERFAVGATLLAGGEEARVVESKRSGGRPVIRLDREAERGAALEVPRAELPPPADDSYYVADLVGLEVVEQGGPSLGRVSEVAPGVANDVLELDSGLALPFVAACVLEVDLEARTIVVAPWILRPRVTSDSLQLDVFTLIPHAFGWLTEQRPVASVLGESLDLRLFSYRDTTPLRAGQVDDDPYGGGPGMVLRVDVVAAALDAAYGGVPDHRVVALTPQGRQLDQAVVEELAAEERLTLLSARFEGFDERIVTHLASDAISIGPYVLSGGELPAMVVVDAIARRLPGALGSEESGLVESFSASLDGGLEYPHYTRPPEFRGWRVPDVLLSGDHGRVEQWRREQSVARTPA